MTGVDNTIDYMDQASFLGLRARGRDPLIQWCWVYSHDVDLAALRRFHHNLGLGLLGRRIERSPLPFGRHRWVSWPGLPDIEIAPAARPRAELREWAVEQARVPIDPEHGPSWRLAVLPLTDGGAAVTLIVSHTIADGVGAVVAVTDAAKGITHDLGYPPPGSRPRYQALKADARTLIRGLPEVFTSVVAAARLARKEGASTVRRKAPEIPAGEAGLDREVVVPSVTVHVDAEHWDKRAGELGGTGPTLLLGFGARCGKALDWLAEDGMVNMSVPISERTPGDERANALTSVAFTVDPDVVTTDLSGVRAQFKDALAGLGESGNDLLGPLPLVPFVPQRVVRRLEGLVLKSKEVGCSYLGELDPATNRPDGTDADAAFFLPFEQGITFRDLRRSDGIFHPVISGRVNGRVWISIGQSNAHGTTTREQLREAAQTALADLHLSGAIE
ncbi:hypothetical protein [Mycolicibacterium sp.]|uniref:hypothetical protein n=1 Tax=Mycolicibacterium sp. TaxID=2320850 RepID=UPI0025EB3E3B|nr:hypothetical protein [Mycolicibacterium sp.]